MTLIDAHSHMLGDDAMVLSMFDELDVHSFNICVAHVGVSNDKQRQQYAKLAHDQPRRYSWITTFDLPDFDDAHYVDRVKAQLDEDFANGAIACKVWKNIGMEIQTPQGQFMQVDHPLLRPIFDHIAHCDKTLLAHIGEPYACWQPLTYDSPHAGYYTDNPQWHMHGKAGFPSFEVIASAFENMISQHPNLRIVGAHIGSQEYDLNEVARRMDRYPNYAVDTSARNCDLMFTDPGIVKEFMSKYGSRVLFGIDLGVPHSQEQDPPRRAKMVAEYRSQFLEARRYFATSDSLVVRGKPVQGIALSDAQLEQLYNQNARQWYQTSVAH